MVGRVGGQGWAGMYRLVGKFIQPVGALEGVRVCGVKNALKIT